MANFAEVEQLALALSEAERTKLAKRLLESVQKVIGSYESSALPKLQSVTSSMIRAVAYYPGDRVLEVVFRNDETYRYQDVPCNEYEGLMAAESKGRYMQEHIIGRYRYFLVENHTE